MFHMCGGFETNFAQLFQDSSTRPLMTLLADRVKSGAVLYIGCCGGAKMAGKFYSCSGMRQHLTMLDLLEGASVGCGDEIEGGPHGSRDVLGCNYINIPTRVAALVHASGGEVDAIAFVCTRTGASKWKTLKDMVQADLDRALTRAPRPQPLPPPPLSSGLQLGPQCPSQQPLSPPLPSSAFQQSALHQREDPAPPLAVPPGPHPAAPTKWTCETKTFTCSLGKAHQYKIYQAVRPRDCGKVVVFYLPSTCLEEPGGLPQIGDAVIVAPVIEPQGGTPYKKACPPWIAELIQTYQRTYIHAVSVKWSLMGFSRGACWGMEIAADTSLRFNMVLLAAPYYLGSWDAFKRQSINNGLSAQGKSIMLIYGEKDAWQPCRKLMELDGSCNMHEIPGVGHDDLPAYVYSRNCWRILAG